MSWFHGQTFRFHIIYHIKTNPWTPEKLVEMVVEKQPPLSKISEMVVSQSKGQQAQANAHLPQQQGLPEPQGLPQQ